MSKWVWVPALMYLGFNLWVFGPDAYDLYIAPAVEGYFYASASR
jgi:hypothetical protein